MGYGKMGGRGSGGKPRDAEARRVALSILGRGLACPGELVELAGFERSTVYHWAAEVGVDWKRKRRLAVAKVWRKAMRHGVELHQAEK
jgi:hypothetical protein